MQTVNTVHSSDQGDALAGGTADRIHGDQSSCLDDFDNFGLPDFLDLAGTQSDAEFGVASTSAAADGGILVFPDALLIVSGDRHDRLPLDQIEGWCSRDTATTFDVDVRIGDGRAFTACLPIVFRAPTVSAMEAALGPAENAA